MKKIILPILALFALNCKSQNLPISYAEFTPGKTGVKSFENLTSPMNGLNQSKHLSTFDSIFLQNVVNLAKNDVELNSGGDIKYYHDFLNSRDKKFKQLWHERTFNLKKKLFSTFDSTEREKLKDTLRILDKLEENYESATIVDRKYFYWYRYHYRTQNYFQPFPVLDRYSCQAFFSNAIDTERFLANAGIVSTVGFSNKAFGSELYHDYIGAFRLGMSVLVSDTKVDKDSISSSEKDSTISAEGAIQRLIAGGGNMLITARLPLLNCHSLSNHINFKAMYTNALALDVQNPAVKDKLPSSIIRTGLECSMFYSGLEGKFVLFANAQSGIIKGNSAFYSNIGSSENKAIWFNQINVGIEVAKFMNISYQINGGNSIFKNKFQNGFSVQLVKGI